MTRQQQRTLVRDLMAESQSPRSRAALWLLFADGLWIGRDEFQRALARHRDTLPESERWTRFATRLPMAAMSSERDKAVALLACQMAGVSFLQPRHGGGQRLTILSRDDFTCRYCGGWADTLDHIHPTSQGGTRDRRNLAAACYPCNQAKGNRSLASMGWRLLPAKPPGTRLLAALDVRSRQLVADAGRHFPDTANETATDAAPPPLLALVAA